MPANFAPQHSDALISNDASDNVGPAQPPDSISATPETSVSRSVADAGVVGGATPDEMTTAIANDLKFTLTIDEALEAFQKSRRKVPSARTLQRYCVDCDIAAQKIRTTYGSEWLINEDSLNRYIRKQPIIEISDVGDAGVPMDPLNVAPSATPSSPVTIAKPEVGDVSADTETFVAGERRRLSDVLIENARLLAQSEGKDNVITEKDHQIAELRDDRSFLREEVREARKQRDQVKEIANRMLETMEKIATASSMKLSQPEAKAMAAIKVAYRPVSQDESAVETYPQQ